MRAGIPRWGGLKKTKHAIISSFRAPTRNPQVNEQYASRGSRDLTIASSFRAPTRNPQVNKTFYEQGVPRPYNSILIPPALSPLHWGCGFHSIFYCALSGLLGYDPEYSSK